MRYADYDERIITEQDLKKYKQYFEKDIADRQRELEQFIERANERIELIKKYEEDKQFIILGHTYKDGHKKEILLIIRYPDGTQRNERYSFDKIAELRAKLDELKEKYSGVDWSKFEEEIQGGLKRRILKTQEIFCKKN